MIVPVLIAFAAFGPPQTTVLAGDTVTWTNEAVRKHAVDGLGEPFDSPELFTGDTYSHQYDAPGAFPYYCRIHLFMRGEVDVFRVLLDTPTAPASTGRPYTLRGRASLPAGSTVPILAEDGARRRRRSSATTASSPCRSRRRARPPTTRPMATRSGSTCSTAR